MGDLIGSDNSSLKSRWYESAFLPRDGGLDCKNCAVVIDRHQWRQWRKVCNVLFVMCGFVMSLIADRLVLKSIWATNDRPYVIIEWLYLIWYREYRRTSHCRPTVTSYLSLRFSVRLLLVFLLTVFLSSPLLPRSDQFSDERFLFTESLERLCLLP